MFVLCIVSGASALGQPRDASTPALAERTSWRREVMYLVMSDRFFNGDPANDRAGHPDSFDPSRPRQFHGGDLAGLTQKLDYLQELGVTALWITPVYKQIADVFV